MTCRQCGGLVMEPGKCYGYAGKVCHCCPCCRPQVYGPIQPYMPYAPPHQFTEEDLATLHRLIEEAKAKGQL